jgi:hypothetical protein
MMDVGGCQHAGYGTLDCELWGGACFDTRAANCAAVAPRRSREDIMRSVTLLFLGALAMTTCQEAEVRAPFFRVPPLLPT